MLALDSAFGIFNNIPSRIDPTGLDLQLPCEEKYFRLSGHQEMVMYSMFPKPKMKVLDAFQRLFTTVVDSEMNPQRHSYSIAGNRSITRTSNDCMDAANLSCWDMMILVHGTCFSILFSMSCANLCSALYFCLAKPLRQPLPKNLSTGLAANLTNVRPDKKGSRKLENHMG